MKPAKRTNRRAKWYVGSVVGISVAFTAAWEGFAPVATHERIDPPGVITWCFGRTNYDDPSVKVGTRFTKAECEKELPETLARYAADVEDCIPDVSNMPPSRQAALISFTYNLGKGNLCKSSVARYLNAGDVRRGCDAMLLYDRANGVVLKGLQNRRRAERELCLRDR